MPRAGQSSASKMKAGSSANDVPPSAYVTFHKGMELQELQQVALFINDRCASKDLYKTHGRVAQCLRRWIDDALQGKYFVFVGEDNMGASFDSEHAAVFKYGSVKILIFRPW
ncbi:hypothetical protein AK812_SmicGene124 [Symbiodinium microadriaticum]|uniref:Uncharacterized protein n=1 Tax=Symbiodinium microadriaticum TaxID=2951 RepID=A0A1Q9F7S2_SYMMI|nr:hypothetical protein AK812_SmicGene124 [Symbiodinium microadriaticum]